MSRRTLLKTFHLGNPLYIGSLMTAWAIDSNGAKTATMITLYANETGTDPSDQLGNPQTLDSYGKLEQPVYFDEPFIATVTGVNIADYDTGINYTTGTYRGVWVTATSYYPGDTVKEPVSQKDIYVVNARHTSGTFATDVASLDLELMIAATAAVGLVDDQWLNSLAATYVSTTTFTLVGDLTTEYHTNRRIKNTGGADRYSKVLSSVFTSLTTVTVTDTSDGAGTPATLHANMATSEVGIISRDSKSSISVYEDLAPSEADNGTLGRNLVYYQRTPQEVTNGITPISYQYKPNTVRRHMTLAQITDALLTSPILDHAALLQNAIDSAPINGVVDCEELNLRLSVTKGTNDKYGVNIQTNGLKLVGTGTIRRNTTDISTYALSYPLILVGAPDSNVAAVTKNVKIKGLEFVGEDTRHSTAGSALHDGRTAIELKNTRNTRIVTVTFTDIDSSAIWYQKPAEFDEENSTYYNTTKNYNSKILGCTFNGAAHSTVNRSFMKAIHATGCDGVLVSMCSAEWCDTFFNSSSTYDDFEDVETDTYTDSNLSATVKRTGRGVAVTGCSVLNSSEHSIYGSGMDVSITGNTVRVTDTTTCTGNAIKIRGRGVAITGNTLSVTSTCVSINEAARLINVSGNTCTQLLAAGGSGGLIDVNSDGLLSYLTARSDYLAANIPMTGINITGNTLHLPSATQTNGYAFRVFTDSSAGALANGHIRGINIEGNTVHNAMRGVVIINTLFRALEVKGNTFYGKNFTEASFATAAKTISATNSGTEDLTITTHNLSVDDAVWVDTVTAFTITSTGTGTTLNQGEIYYVKTVTDSDNVILAKRKGGAAVNITNDGTGALMAINALVSVAAVEYQSSASGGQLMSFDNNTVIGYRYIFNSDGSAGGNDHIPYGIRGNTFNYCYELRNDALRTPDYFNKFNGNQGDDFLDRSWRTGFATDNSIGNGIVSNSLRNGQINIVSSSDVRIYHDDAGGYKAL